MAIDELLDEHEQGERVRDWLRRNGVGIVSGVLIGFALIGGWKWWQGQQHTQRMQAGAAYQSMLLQLENGNLEQAIREASSLGRGAYATLAALDIAKVQVEAGKRDAAIATLRGIGTADPALASIVDQRLARLLIDAGKPQEALQLLAGTEDAASLEIQGDAQVVLGQPEQAHKAYTDALARLDVAAPQRRLVEIKLTNVGG
jgi:predicted negative regulator of RcsB-dependent stress response